MKQDEIPSSPDGEMKKEAPSSPEERLEAVAAELEEANRKADEAKALLQRVQADFVNFRRRSEDEREELHKFLNASLISKLLPVLDELDMAIDHASGASPDAAWIEGVRLIERKLHVLLESEGVTLIKAEGQTFDPSEHEAIGFRETAEHEEGHVVEVTRQGYKVNGRVLRAAQVILAKGSEPAH